VHVTRAQAAELELAAGDIVWLRAPRWAAARDDGAVPAYE